MALANGHACIENSHFMNGHIPTLLCAYIPATHIYTHANGYIYAFTRYTYLVDPRLRKEDASWSPPALVPADEGLLTARRLGEKDCGLQSWSGRRS